MPLCGLWGSDRVQHITNHEIAYQLHKKVIYQIIYDECYEKYYVNRNVKHLGKNTDVKCVLRFLVLHPSKKFVPLWCRHEDWQRGVLSHQCNHAPYSFSSGGSARLTGHLTCSERLNMQWETEYGDTVSTLPGQEAAARQGIGDTVSIFHATEAPRNVIYRLKE